jgi:hypothetical protein
MTPYDVPGICDFSEMWPKAMEKIKEIAERE